MNTNILVLIASKGFKIIPHILYFCHPEYCDTNTRKVSGIISTIIAMNSAVQLFIKLKGFPVRYMIG